MAANENILCSSWRKKCVSVCVFVRVGAVALLVIEKETRFFFLKTETKVYLFIICANNGPSLSHFVHKCQLCKAYKYKVAWTISHE